MLALLVMASVVLVARLWLSLPSLTYLPTHTAYTPPPPVPVVAPEPLAIELMAPHPALELPNMAGYPQLWQRVEAGLPAEGGVAVDLGTVVKSIDQAKLAAAAVWPSGVPFGTASLAMAPSLIVLTGGTEPQIFWLSGVGWRQAPGDAALATQLSTPLDSALATTMPAATHPFLLDASGILPTGQVVISAVPVDQLVPSFLPLPLSVEAIDEGADGVAYTDGSTVLHVERSGAFQVQMGAAADYFGLGPVPAALSFVSAHPGFSPDMAVGQVTGRSGALGVHLLLTVQRLPLYGAGAASVEFAARSVVGASSAALGVVSSGSGAFSLAAGAKGLSATLSAELLAIVPVELDQSGAFGPARLLVLTNGEELVLAGAGG